MGTSRIEAFSDAVLAIIITIMVLEMDVPHGTGLSALQPMLPVFLSYVLSFVYLGIYWNNHHHMLHVTERVTGGVLWANLHLLFWLTLVPFTTSWMGENGFAPLPTALYGGVLLMAAIAYWILQRAIVAGEGAESLLATAVGRDLKGNLSPVLYVLAILAAFVRPWIAGALYVIVALIWLVPDRRIERTLARRAVVGSAGGGSAGGSTGEARDLRSREGDE
ncbi:MAG: TMEM175 family protein [Gemmatimonadota bacterium]